ncbi:hypothetical protein PENTCL1PPCAC_666, partial [Pristionchus entomophagus]
KDVKEMECLAGSIVYGGETLKLDLQVSCRTSHGFEAKKRIRLWPYFLGLTFFLLFIVVIIATIFLQVTGQGWLHTMSENILTVRNRNRALSTNCAKSLPKII